MTADRPLLDEDEVRTWAAYAGAARRLFAQLDREMQRDAGLPMSYWELLGHLAAAPGGAMRMSDLAEVTRSAPSRLTHAVTQLESSGLVRRRRCATDRRGCHAQLTDRGVEAHAAAGDTAARCLRTHFLDRISAADQECLRGVGEAILAHLGPGCEAPAGAREG